MVKKTIKNIFIDIISHERKKIIKYEQTYENYMWQIEM